jgi:glycosyltransferase involved in cell wall biosynthesis
MNREIANFFWYGELSKFEKACISSFVKNNFEVHIWSYSNLSVPGAISRDAREVFPEEDVFKYKIIRLGKYNSKHSDISTFSDIFRYKVLELYSGWWFDTDCYCLKDQSEFKKLREEKRLVLGFQSVGFLANGAVIWADRDVSAKMSNNAEKFCKSVNYELPYWAVIGPTLATQTTLELGLESLILPINYFYAIQMDQDYLYTDPKNIEFAKSLIKDSFVTHIWKMEWKSKNIDKNNPPINTLLYEFVNDTYTNDTVQDKNVIEISNNYKKRFSDVINLYREISSGVISDYLLRRCLSPELTLDEIRENMNVRKKNYPKVSIIITCYNYGRFVADAINSALSQTYKNLQVIVVNDGSTDNSDEVIKQFSGKITYINQNNAGAAQARNNGIAESAGDYCICLDADDYISPDYVSDAVKLIDENTIVSPAMYMADKDLNPNGKFWPTEYVIKTNGNTLREILIQNKAVQTSMFPKKKWEIVGGYDKNTVRAEDYIFWVDLVNAGCKVKYLDPKKMYLKYRLHGPSRKNIVELSVVKEYVYKKYNIFKESFSREEKIKAIYNLVLKRDPFISEIKFHTDNVLPWDHIVDNLTKLDEYKLTLNKISSSTHRYPKVSIIITCYNYGRFVADAINSALNQTYKNLEVIVVNDGSTDNSNEIIKQFKDKITYINQDNVGVAQARNNGIAASIGEYCICLDADDYISSDYVSDAVRLIDKDTIVSPVSYMTDKDLNPTGKFWPTEYLIKTNKNTFKDILIRNRAPAPAMFPKEKWKIVGGYDPNNPKVEDYQFWIDLFKIGCKIKYLNPEKVYLKYRIHGPSRSNSIDDNIGMEYVYKKYNIFKESFSREDKIKAIYNLVLERDPSISEIKFHANQLSSWTSIIMELIKLDEYKSKFDTL